MSGANAGRLGVCLILGLGLGLSSARGEGKDSTQAVKPNDAAKTRRIVYVVQHGDAKDLATILSKHFKGAAEVQVLPESSSNCLLINTPAAVFAEVVKLLAQLDRRPQTIIVEVLLVEVTPPKGDRGKPDAAEKDLDVKEFSGPAADVMARLKALRGKGRVGTLKRLQLTVVEGQPSSVLLGKMKPSVAGVQVTATGLVSRQITYRNVGTQTRVTARVGAEKKVHLDLEVTASRLVPDDTIVLGKDEGGAPIRAMDIVTSRLSSKLSLASGQALAAQGVKTTSRSGRVQTLVIVAAKIVDPDARPAKEGPALERSRRPIRRFRD